MNTIQQKIELLYFHHIVSTNGIIEDEGEHNVPLEHDNNIRYTFTDTNEYGSRTISEQEKLKFINDAMEIMSDIHLYIHHIDSMNKPIYFIPEQKQIDPGAPPDHEDEYEKNEIEKLNDEIDEMSI